MKTMKHISKIFAVTTVAMLALSCDKNSTTDPMEEPAGGKEGNGLSGPYALAVSAGRDLSDGTRAYLDPTQSTYSYLWDTNESIKLTVATQGATAPISPIASVLDRVTLTSTNTERAAHVNFVKDNTDEAPLYAALQTAPTFDYYAYYANGKSVTDSNFPNTISFPLPASYSGLATNSFAGAQTPMVGVVKDHAPNIMYAVGDLDSQLAENVNNGVHFDFDHTTAYAAIEFDVRLFASVTVSAITMTVSGGTPDQNMVNGTYTYDIATQTATLAGGSNSIALSGLNLSIGNGDKVYFPMPAKTFAGQMFTFYCTFSGLGGNTYSQYVTGTPASFEFVRGEINTIRLAPTTAGYASSQDLTFSHTGYYYIEAWGGDGGAGGHTTVSWAMGEDGPGGVSGKGARIGGLYKFNAGESISIRIGSAGTDGQIGNNDPARTGTVVGGSNGTSWGAGANGGWGGSGQVAGSPSGAGGGGGGAATMVFRNSSNSLSNLIIASGGGGGGGGAGGSHKGGAGGSSNGAGTTVAGVSPMGNGGAGWSSSYTYGVGVPSGSINGEDSYWWLDWRGGGGGGGGGGWDGSAGGGGQSGNGGENQPDTVGQTKGGAGGGAGGKSAKITETVNAPGYTLPTNTRPSGHKNGYVVITFLGRTD
jgi:hypothetical protein